VKRLLCIPICLGLTNLAAAQLSLENFDGGTFPPAGWTVVDNIGNGDVWQTSSYWTHGNLSGGSGECAAIDSDNVGSGTIYVDTELITPAFDIPASSYFAEFDHYFLNLISGSDYGDLDLSVGGGAWTNLKHYGADVTEHAQVSLDPYAGSTNCQLRFHYADLGVWAWYWHVDDVEVLQGTPPPPALWTEDFDGGTFPPAGWTVIDNAGNGNVWQTSSYFTHGNLTSGSGEAAAVDDDAFGSGQACDTELITPSFDLPAGTYDFEFLHYFNQLGDVASLDVSVGGGAWTGLRRPRLLGVVLARRRRRRPPGHAAPDRHLGRGLRQRHVPARGLDRGRQRRQRRRLADQLLLDARQPLRRHR